MGGTAQTTMDEIVRKQEKNNLWTFGCRCSSIQPAELYSITRIEVLAFGSEASQVTGWKVRFWKLEVVVSPLC